MNTVILSFEETEEFYEYSDLMYCSNDLIINTWPEYHLKLKQFFDRIRLKYNIIKNDFSFSLNYIKL